MGKSTAIHYIKWHAGDLAFADTMMGLIPCQILGKYASKPGDNFEKILVRSTVRRDTHHIYIGEIMMFHPLTVVPRSNKYTANGIIKIVPFEYNLDELPKVDTAGTQVDEWNWER